MMRQCKLLFVVTLLAVCAIALYGCFGGGGGGGSTSVFKSNSTINGYVFVPEGSVGKRGMTQPLTVQAPPGMVPLVGATVKLSDGTVTITDNNGRYEFKIKVEAVEGETKSVEVWINETGTEKITYEVKVEIDKYTVCSAKLEDLNGDGKLDVKEIIAPPPTIVKPGSGGEDDPEEIIPVIIAATYEFAGLQEVADLQTGGEAQLSWTAPTLPSTLADDIPMTYSIYASKTSGEYDFAAAPIKAVTNGAVTTTVSDLDNDTYYFMVRAKTSKGKIEDEPNTVEESVMITDATAPTFDGIQAVTTGDGQATVYWNEATDNTGPLSYKVYYHTATPATGGTSVAVADPTASSGQYQYQHTITGLTNGTTYYFIIHALDAVPNEDDNTAEENTMPKSTPGAPGNVAANLGYEKIVVSWDAPSDTGGDTITSYEVYRGLSAESVSLLASGITETSYDDGAGDASPLVVDQTYYYKVKAVNSIGDGPLSTDASATYMLVPPSPQNLRASNVTTTGFTFEWDDVDGEDGYRVYKDDVQQGSDLVADSTSAILSGLTTNTAYNMEVLAFNIVGPGNESSLIVETLPPAPVGVEPADVASTGFSISWTAVSGEVVDGYRVYVDGTQYGNDVTSGTTIAVTGLNPGTSYSIEVSAFTGGGTGEAGGEGAKSSSAVEVLTLPDSPTGLVASDVTTTSFTLDWNEVSGEVSGYKAYIDGAPDPYDTTIEPPMNITGLSAGTSYSMQVSAYNDTGEGEKSAASPVETRPEAVLSATVTAGNITASSFTVSWDAVTGADGYRVYIDSSQYGTDVTSGTFLSVSERTAGTSYSVEVSAYTAGGEGAKSLPAVEVLTLPDAPAGLIDSDTTTTSFSLNWDAVSGEVSGYKVYIDGAPDPYGTTTETSMNVTSLSAGTSYSMQVSAYNDTGEGEKSAASPVETRPEAVLSATVTAGNITASSFTVSWDAVTGADGYRVYIDSSQYGTDVTSGTFLSVSERTAGTSYSVEVSAYTTGGEGEKSSPAVEVLTLPDAPAGLIASDATTTSFTLNWNEVSGEVSGYKVYIDSTPDPYGTTTETSMNITGLSAGTSYSMQVSAYNDTGEGEKSEAEEVSTTNDASLTGTVTPTGTNVQLWEGTTKVAEDNDTADGNYSLTTNLTTAQNLQAGTYTLRAYKRISEVNGYYIEQEIILNPGTNPVPIAATAINKQTLEMVEDLPLENEAHYFSGEVTFNGSPIRQGDYITVKYQTDKVCGLFIVDLDGFFDDLVVVGDIGETTSEIEGPVNGETLTFYINNQYVAAPTTTFQGGGENASFNISASSGSQ